MAGLVERIKEWQSLKHSPGGKGHLQQRHGYRNADSNAIYRTAERLGAANRGEAVQFLAKQASQSGYIPFAAIRGQALGGLSKQEMAQIRTAMEGYAKRADKLAAKKGPAWQGRGSRALAEFDSAAKNQWAKPKGATGSAKQKYIKERQDTIRKAKAEAEALSDSALKLGKETDAMRAEIRTLQQKKFADIAEGNVAVGDRGLIWIKRGNKLHAFQEENGRRSIDSRGEKPQSGSVYRETTAAKTQKFFDLQDEIGKMLAKANKLRSDAHQAEQELSRVAPELVPMP